MVRESQSDGGAGLAPDEDREHNLALPRERIVVPDRFHIHEGDGAFFDFSRADVLESEALIVDRANAATE